MPKKVSQLQTLISPDDNDLMLVSDLEITGNASRAISFASIWNWVLSKLPASSPTVAGLRVSELSGAGTRYVTVSSDGTLGEVPGAGSGVPMESNLVEFADNTTENIQVGTLVDRMIYINYYLETRTSSQQQGGQIYILHDDANVYVRHEYAVGAAEVENVTFGGFTSSGGIYLSLSASSVGENLRFRWQKTASIEAD